MPIILSASSCSVRAKEPLMWRLRAVRCLTIHPNEDGLTGYTGIHNNKYVCMYRLEMM